MMESNSFIESLESAFGLYLNEQQKTAILHKDGPAVVLAVPGSGKTTVLICRIAYLILCHNIHPSNILSVTFSKASALDMDKRFHDLFEDKISDTVNFSTIHRLAYEVVRRYNYATGKRLTLIEGEICPISKNFLLRKLYKDINEDYISEDKLDILVNSIGFVKNMMYTADQIAVHDTNIENFYEIFNAYEDAKRTHDYLDFDDMLTHAHDILKTNPQILKKYQNQYPYIQVDEGQDTSLVQYAIIRLLAGSMKNILLVGDEDQSIYGFRAAFPKELLDFGKNYPGARTLFMEQNYRSANNIVHVANLFIQQNKVRYRKDMFTENAQANAVMISKVKNEKEQMAILIRHLRQANDLSNTAILYRNNLSSIALADTLNQFGILFYVRDVFKNFFTHWVVQDLLAFMGLGRNPYDLSMLERIYYKSNAYIPKEALLHAQTLSEDIDVFARLLNYPGLTDAQRKRIIDFSDGIKKCGQLRPNHAIHYIEDDLDYTDYLEKRSQRSGYSLEGLKALIHSLKEVAQNAKDISSLLSRLKELQDVIVSSKFNKHKNAVTLSTVHSAKGLEFETVKMIDLVEGIFPNEVDDVDANENALEEERRLFYVGITRAKISLELIVPFSRYGKLYTPSQFIHSIEAIISPPPPKKVMQQSPSLKKGVPEGDTPKRLPNGLLTSDLIVGNSVRHVVWGIGAIKEVKQDTVVVSFPSKGDKNLDISSTLEHYILRKV